METKGGIFKFIIFLLILSIFFIFNGEGFAKKLKIISRSEWIKEEYKDIIFNDYHGYDKIRQKMEDDKNFINSLKGNELENHLKEVKEKEDQEKIKNMYLKKYFKNIYFNLKKITQIDGHNLYWDIEKKNVVKKIIIHHTATTNDYYNSKDEFIDYLNGVLKFHSITREWGDIGYNFIIDKWGNIYEGRVGGMDIVGAHAYFNNNDSIGISLMGNFETDDLNPKQIESLLYLTMFLSEKYKINPKKQTYYFKKIKIFPYVKSYKYWNIAGHKDAGKTACPGKNLYKAIPKIRKYIYKYLMLKKEIKIKK